MAFVVFAATPKAFSMAAASESPVRNGTRQPPSADRDGSPDPPRRNGMRRDVSDPPAARADFATLAAAGIAAYILTDLTYLVFHSLACVWAGCELVEIAASAVRKLPPPQDAMDPFLVHGGGSMGNLLVFLAACALTNVKAGWPASTKFFLWLAMTLNGLVAGGQIFISNAFDAGDWAMLTQNWPYRILWKLLFTAIGLGIAFFAFTRSREGIEYFLGREPDQRRMLLPRLVGIPYAAGGTLITAAAALSVNNRTESILVAAVWTFGLTAWMLVFAARPHLPRPSTPHRPLLIGRSVLWIAAAAILAAAFLAVLGPGIWLYS